MNSAISKIKYPLLLKLFALFLFFLPLRSIEIMNDLTGIGFSISFARLFNVLMLLLICASACLDLRYFDKLFRSRKFRNPFVFWLFAYFILSIIYYYILVVLGETLLFAHEDVFFRNWQGRPIAQILVFISYALIPFYITKKYAQDDRSRRFIERALAAAALFVLYYGCFQLISYAFGFPVTGRNIFEIRDLGNTELWGINFYRVNSLAGEPRDYGSFMAGAVLFYWYFRQGKINWFAKINTILMIITFFLAASTSAFVIAGLSLVFIIIDIIYRKRVRIRGKYIKYGILLLLMILILFQAQIIAKIGIKTAKYYTAISEQIITSEMQPIAQSQSVDLIIPYYIKDVLVNSPFYLLIGYGYSNFLTPIAEVLINTFDYDIAKDPWFVDTRSYAIKIFVETGLVGLSLYLMMFLYALQLNNKLLAFDRRENNKAEYKKTLLLRYTFIVFFISSAIQTSFYYFIIMGLIIGKLNNAVKKYESGNS